MAIQPQKKNTKSSRKKPHVKKRTTKKTSKRAHLKKNILIVVGVALMIVMVIFGYFLGQENDLNTQTSMRQTKKKEEIKSKTNLTKAFSKIEVKKPKEEEKKVVVKQKEPKVHLAKLRGKPKLVIIIDDVSTASQLKQIQALDMKITPSIFPPFEHSMQSHTLARGLKHYMIHLPMESGSNKFNAQYKTLKISFNKEQIMSRAKELRILFPSAHYVNNHTGSVFTDDYNRMLTLYTALKKEGFMFVDSRTIASTKVPKIAKEFGDVYVARDTFIDNIHNINTIHKQLGKAVEIAKKKGYAIAIGHPNAVTMQALSSAERILEEVELVYIDDLMTI